MWLKIWRTQIFWFCNSNVTTFPTSRKCKNFNFSHYTVPAEVLYFQKYLTNFQKLFFWLKEEERGYCGSKFQVHRYFGFAIATLQLFQLPQNVKISIFPLQCPSRNVVSPEIFNEFSKTFFGWKTKKVSIVVKNFKCPDILDFEIATLKLFQNPENVKFQFSIYTVPAEILYLQKYSTNFQKLFSGWKKRNMAIVLQNFKCTDILVLQ